MAAVFAVLTRMRKPNPDRYPRGLSIPLQSLTAVEKAGHLRHGERPPERLDVDAQKLLRAHVRELYEESDAYPIYEGRIGASPREMRAVLLDAAQSPQFQCLSPLAVLDEIEALCERKNEFEWLQQDAISGGYHDVKQFRESIAARLLSSWETELYASSGLVDDVQYTDLFERYVQHVSVWVKKERIRNRVTGEYEEPDEKMMREVERLLETKGRCRTGGGASSAGSRPGRSTTRGRRSKGRPSFRSTCGECARRSATTAAQRWRSLRGTSSSSSVMKGRGSTRSGGATRRPSSIG